MRNMHNCETCKAFTSLCNYIAAHLHSYCFVDHRNKTKTRGNQLEILGFQGFQNKQTTNKIK